jgi:signal peptidase I
MAQTELREEAAGETKSGEPRSRALAFVLSLFVPGMGHVYLGQWRRAVLWVCAPVALFCAFTIRFPLRGTFAWFVPLMVLTWAGVWLGAAIDVWLVPRSRHRKTAWWLLPLFWLGSIAFSVSTAFTLRTFVVQAFKIPGGSMEPTLMVGDHVFVDMRAFHAPPRRGQLAVFTTPEGEDQDYVKRIIGLPGDRVAVSGSHPTINGWPVPHCHVGHAQLPERDSGTIEQTGGEVELEFLGDQAYLTFNEDGHDSAASGSWLVPPGNVFVLGDNRNNSYDSRAWFGGRGGGVPFAKLIGQPAFVWLAFDPNGSVNWARYALPLDEPALATWAPELAAGLRDCIAKRPPLSETEPPRAAQ